MKIIRMICSVYLLSMVSCSKTEFIIPVKQGFLSFHAPGQTLSTALHEESKKVILEIGHKVDPSTLKPEFTLPKGYKAFVNGVEQVSGMSSLDMSEPVIYELKDEQNRAVQWEVSAIPLGCKILVDASHDGGGWWFPQSEKTGFDATQNHQGKYLADYLRSKGFEVNELGRGTELTEEMFFGYYIVIRFGGWPRYTENELNVYKNLLGRGMNMLFVTDYWRPTEGGDNLGEYLGLKFKGVAKGTIATFTPHMLTANISSIGYIAGSVITNADQNSNIQILGWLSQNDFVDLNGNEFQDGDEPSAPPVMGLLTYPKSRIFFIGDMNGIESSPKTFIDNLIVWMGTCFSY